MAFVINQDSCIPVRSIFEVERQLSAPLYQRQYSWKKNNIDEFWGDIRLVEEEQAEALFLGAIILKHEGPSNPSAGSLEKFLVLDGQQRLATLFLTLLAISLEWQEHGHDPEARSIAETFLMSIKTATKGQPRFLPTIPDTPEFGSLCRNLKVDWNLFPPEEFKIGRMSEAFELIQSEVRNRSRGESGFDPESLRTLELLVVDKVEIVAINIADRHQPNEVFDRLNRKGQALTVGDLVKNEVFRRLSTEAGTAIKLYNEHWRPFEKSFTDKKRLDDYYYPFTLSVDDSATVARSFNILNDHWNKTIKDVDDSRTVAELIINDLGRFVPEYNALSARSEYKTTPSIAERIECLYRMPAPRVTYAFLIQLLESHRKGGVSELEAAECLRIVESFLVRRAFSGLEPTGLHAVFKSLWRRNGGNPEELAADLQTSTIDFPDDDRFRNDIAMRPFYGRRLDKFVLAELEIETHRTNPLSREQLDDITVDHLAPQSLKGAWSDEFPSDEEERHRLLGLLGNLVPLSQSDNSTKGAGTWEEARTFLKNETIYRTARDVLDKYDKWGPNEIVERTKNLADLCVNRWPRPGQ